MRGYNQNRLTLGVAVALILIATFIVFKKPAVEPISQTVIAPTAATSEPVVTSRIRSANPANQTSQAEFQELVDTTYGKLVLSSDLKDVGKRAWHDTPSETYANSESFGEIMDDVKANPALAESAMDFYERCALNSEVIAPTRAVCLSHLIYWTGKKGIVLDKGRFPAEVRETAEKLPVLWEPSPH